MTLPAGTKLGPYEILSPLGAGGMGEVYRAMDPRLSREVALKVLPENLGSDPDRIRRFEQEARAAGKLNHPNVTAVYDVGNDAERGVLYIVSELLEGETLRARMAGGALPVRKALDYARQIAAGLAAAHGKGILHRDLKPENIFVTNEGRVKILDLGLAKLTQNDASPDATSLPTATAGTEPGVVLGTLAYMSPEQVRGRATDARSDIFSFGAVLYEMLSGRRAFHRDSAADTISAILKEEPPELSATNQSVSPGLDRVVRHCLEKNPEERFHSAHDLAFDLESLSGASSPAAAAPIVATQRAGWRGARPLLAAIGLLAAGGMLGGLLWPRGRVAAPTAPPRLSFVTHSGDDWHPTASPDGKLIAFTSHRGGRDQIWLKELAGGNEIALTSGDDRHPVFTADGSAILFQRSEGSSATLFRVPAVGGEPRRLVPNIRDAALSPDGTRLAFLRMESGETRREWTLWLSAPDGGGAAEIGRFLDPVMHPCWSPDGKRLAAVRQDTSTLRVPARMVIFEGEKWVPRELSPVREPGIVTSLQWDPSGDSLLYAQSEILSAAMLTGVGHLRRRQIGSERVDTLISSPTPIGFSAFAIVGDGRIVLDAEMSRQNLKERHLGSAERTVRFLTRGVGTDRQPAYSPDGNTIVFSSNREGNFDIWQVSRATGALRRVTEDAGEDWDPAFTPDGRKLLWSSNRGGHFEIWTAEVDGSGARQVSSDGVDAQNPAGTPDGSWIVYSTNNPDKRGVWKVRPDGRDAVRIVSGSTQHPEISPDGKHVLYFLDAQGGWNLQVATLAEGTRVFEIPLVRMTRARWAPEGSRILFLDFVPESGVHVYSQDFVPGRDTAASRRRVTPDDPAEIETFGLSPDGTHVALAAIEYNTAIMLAQGIPGVRAARR
jgi:Tol biopolymer transport system component